MENVTRRSCAVEDCERAYYCRGYCELHYRRVRLYGDPDANFAKLRPPCKVEGCPNPHDSHGYCGKHAQAWRKYGNPLAKSPARPKRLCKVDGCGKKHYSLGYCSTHYGRVRAHGTPEGRPQPPKAKRLCAAPGCGRSRSARGYCRWHDSRLRKGLPLEPAAPACLPGEEWRAVVGGEGRYMVSSRGRVKSLPRVDCRKGGVHVRNAGRILKETTDRGGYRLVSMALEGARPRKLKVHVLVARAFLGLRPAGADINHINGKKTDNRAVNLEYVSRGENIAHAYEMGLMTSRGAKNGRATITEEQARYIYRMKGVKLQRELAAEIGCSKAVVANIQSGRAWRHIHQGDQR